MIHPAEYVSASIARGAVEEVIDLLHTFRTTVINSHEVANFHISSFSVAFLLSVVGQLRCLHPGQDLHDDPLLSVWAGLGYFGILRESIPGNLEE